MYISLENGIRMNLSAVRFIEPKDEIGKYAIVFDGIFHVTFKDKAKRDEILKYIDEIMPSTVIK